MVQEESRYMRQKIWRNMRQEEIAEAGIIYKFRQRENLFCAKWIGHDGQEEGWYVRQEGCKIWGRKKVDMWDRKDVKCEAGSLEFVDFMINGEKERTRRELELDIIKFSNNKKILFDKLIL